MQDFVGFLMSLLKAAHPQDPEVSWLPLMPLPILPIEIQRNPKCFLRILVNVSAGDRPRESNCREFNGRMTTKGWQEGEGPTGDGGHLGPARVGSCVHPRPEGAKGGSGYQTSVRAAAIGEGRLMELGPCE